MKRLRCPIASPSERKWILAGIALIAILKAAHAGTFSSTYITPSFLGTNASANIGVAEGGIFWGDGYGDGTGGQDIAIVWTSISSASAVNMNPVFSTEGSEIQGRTSGGTFWGNAGESSGVPVIWTGLNAASAIDMTPTYVGSNAYSFIIRDTSSGGWVGAAKGTATNDEFHATRWTGNSGDTAVDMGPSFLGTNAYSYIDRQVNGVYIGQGFGSATGGDYIYHALVWTGDTAASAKDLTASYLGSNVYSQISLITSDNKYIVRVENPASGTLHTTLWNSLGDADPIDITPTALLGGHEQVFIFGEASPGKYYGSGRGDNFGGKDHALLWSGPDASIVTDLTPTTLLGSNARAAINGQLSTGVYYGFGQGGNIANTAALIWTGDDASTAVDITPTFLTGSKYTFINGVTADDILYGKGTAGPGGEMHPIIWTGITAASAVDMLPAFLGSDGSADLRGITSDGVFYGNGYGSGVNGYRQAIIWTGLNAGSAMNLTALTPDQRSGSVYGYDDTTSSFYGYSYTLSNDFVPVVWKLVQKTGSDPTEQTVANGAETYLIGNGFTQNSGFTAIGAGSTLFVTDGNAGNGKETFTLNGGTLSGNGTLDANLENLGGIVSPGASPGELTIDGDYTQSDAGTLLVQLDGANPGEWDVLNITGTANLGGILTLDLGYVPTAGTGFDFLITQDGLNGFFDTVNLTGLSDGITYEIQYLTPGEIGASGTSDGYRASLHFIAVVPEPGTLTLFLPILALGGLALARRRR